MPKKTYYTKEEKTEIEITKSQTDDKPPEEPVKIDTETSVKQETPPPRPPTPRPPKPKPKGVYQKTILLQDENGNRLTKKGTIDKRAQSSKENLKKSRVYQQILEKKKAGELVKEKVVSVTPYPDTSDSETEFEVEGKLEIEPEPPKPVRNGTDDFIKKQEAEREKMLADQIKAMEIENKRLKDQFHYNSHLNRLQTLSTNVKLKF